jgi:hypothetical protein
MALERDLSSTPGLWVWGQRHGLILALVALGVVLRSWQYSGDATMWSDEIAIAQNVRSRSMWGLLSFPLVYGVAPAGFLIVEKIVTTIAGPSDYAFRLWPFVASIAALVLFARIASTRLSVVAASVSVALFSLATPLVWQGAQAKQYSSDVLATVTIVWLAQRLGSGTGLSRRTFAAAAALGAAMIVMSHTSVFILAAVSAWLVFQAWRNRQNADHRPFWPWLALAGVWLAAALGGIWYSTSMIAPELQPFLQNFWRHGFPPDSFSPVVQGRWLAGRLVALFGAGAPLVGGFSYLEYGSAGAAIAVALAAGGTAVLAFRQPWLAATVVLSVGVTLLAAALGRYPFDNRLILFLLPLFLLAIGAAVGAIERLGSIGRRAAVVVALAVVGIAARPYVVTGVPTFHVTPHVKPALQFVQSHRQPTDEVFMLGVQSSAFAYYADHGELAPKGFVVGACYVDPRGDRYLDDLTPFRGTPRLWVLFSGPHRTLRDLLVGFLDAAGRRLDAFGFDYARVNNPTPGRVEALLYDLSDGSRFDAARGTGVRAVEGVARAIECPVMSAAPGRHGATDR